METERERQKDGWMVKEKRSRIEVFQCFHDVSSLLFCRSLSFLLVSAPSLAFLCLSFSPFLRFSSSSVHILFFLSFIFVVCCFLTRMCGVVIVLISMLVVTSRHAAVFTMSWTKRTLTSPSSHPPSHRSPWSVVIKKRKHAKQSKWKRSPTRRVKVKRGGGMR